MAEIIFSEDFEKELASAKRIFILTDKNVERLHLKNITKEIYSIIPGEISKTRKEKLLIEDVMLKSRFGRDSILIAIGGGVVTDLGGFIAATFNRGISLVNVPTTLLGMVDASVGGKNGVNTEHGKNLIGTFFEPEKVIVDLNFLETLEMDEFKNGLAEVMKMAIALDSKLFDYLEENSEKILNRDRMSVEHIVRRCIELKQSIVNKDPKEAGLRQVLNFGHTIGHGIELLSEYKIKHGFAVAVGCVEECKISNQNKILSDRDLDRIIDLFKRFDVWKDLDFNINKIVDACQLDKKSLKNEVHIVMIETIGKFVEKNGKYSFPI